MYIAMYDQRAKLVESTIKKCWKRLQGEPKYGYLFKEPPRFMYREERIVGSQLVRSDLENRKVSQQTFLSTANKGTLPCLSCHYCPSIIKGPNIIHPTKGNPIPIKKFFTCNCRNAIYL